MTFKHSKEFIIGLCVIAALLVGYFGIEYLKGNNIFKPANYYYASYTNVAGLAQSAPVTLNGFKIGIVRDIQYDYDNPGHVKVEMSLDKELQLPDGTQAMLVTDMLGTSSISILMGTSPKMVEVGGEIIGTNAPGLMGSVTEEILPSVASMVPKIDSLITALNTIATDPTIKASLENINATMLNLKNGSANLARVMNRVPGIADDAAVTVTNFRSMSESLSTIAVDLTDVSGKLKEMPLDATVQNLYTTSESLNQLIAKLNQPNSSLGLLLNDENLYRNLTNASASLDSLLIDVKKNPKRYISIKLL
ncbi:MAG: MCE family protein [Muribaculaceae bacterium]|nr:MCE family protein [Muribaculaceae bacterium]